MTGPMQQMTNINVMPMKERMSMLRKVFLYTNNAINIGGVPNANVMLTIVEHRTSGRIHATCLAHVSWFKRQKSTHYFVPLIFFFSLLSIYSLNESTLCVENENIELKHTELLPLPRLTERTRVNENIR
jgi:hypothetical protein